MFPPRMSSVWTTTTINNSIEQATVISTARMTTSNVEQLSHMEKIVCTPRTQTSELAPQEPIERFAPHSRSHLSSSNMAEMMMRSSGEGGSSGRSGSVPTTLVIGSGCDNDEDEDMVIERHVYNHVSTENAFQEEQDEESDEIRTVAELLRRRRSGDKGRCNGRNEEMDGRNGRSGFGGTEDEEDEHAATGVILRSTDCQQHTGNKSKEVIRRYLELNTRKIPGQEDDDIMWDNESSRHIRYEQKCDRLQFNKNK